MGCGCIKGGQKDCRTLLCASFFLLLSFRMAQGEEQGTVREADVKGLGPGTRGRTQNGHQSPEGGGGASQLRNGAQ